MRTELSVQTGNTGLQHRGGPGLKIVLGICPDHQLNRKLQKEMMDEALSMLAAQYTSKFLTKAEKNSKKTPLT